MRMSNLTPTKPPKGSDDESSDEESDDEDEQPELECAQIRHFGSVNRLKVCVVVRHSCTSSRYYYRVCDE